MHQRSVDRGCLSRQLNGARDYVFTATKAGNVGIGTTGPTQKLDVAGYVKGQTGLCIGNDCRTSWPAGVAGGFCVFKRTNYVCPSWAPVQEGLKLIGSFNNLDDKRNGDKGHGYYITVCCGP